MRKKRALLIAIAAVYLLSCFTGCKKQENPDNSSSGDVISEVSSVDDTISSEDGESTADVSTVESSEGTTSQGSTVSNAYVSRPQTNTNTKKGKITVMSIDRASSNYSMAKKSKILTEIETQTNTEITFNLYPESNYETIKSTRLAAGVNLPDIMFTGWSNDATPGYKGLFVDLKDLISKHAPNITKVYNQYPAVRKQNTTAEGKLFWVTTVDQTQYKGKELPIVHTVSIRKDWLTKAGISKVPETTEEFYQALKAFREKDVNGNGLKDEIFAMWFNWQDAVQGWFGVPSDSFSIDQKTGKAKYVWDYDGAFEFISYMRRLYTEKLIDQDLFNISQDNILTKISQNKVSAISYWTDCTSFEQQTGESSAEYVPMKALKTETGSQGQFCYYNQGNSNANYAITKSCKDPVAAIKFLDWFYSDYAQQLAVWGLEGVHCEYKNGKLQYTQNYINSVIQGKDVATIDDMFDWVPCLPAVRIKDWEATYTAEHYPAKTLTKLDAQLQISTWKELVYSNPIGLATLDETKKMADLSGDMSTFAVETITRFITGKEKNFNRSTWDKFVQKLHSDYPLDERLKIFQAQYDRLK